MGASWNATNPYKDRRSKSFAGCLDWLCFERREERGEGGVS